ncbi:hypothetical protein I4U23_023551 [Adineta vaga]|nr:hypothetical protein I4U23_023551 [Adineta vaga]
MMNSSSDDINDTLKAVPYQLNIWFGIFLWIAGNLGCLGNVIVFRSRTFRKRAYSIYLFSAAIADFHYFNFVLITRVLQKGFGISLMNQYILICKLRQFSTIWGNVSSFSLFSFAIIDRLLSTHRSNAYRKWSNQIGLAYRMIFIIPFVWFVLLVHRIILYRTKNGICGPLEGFYQHYDNYFQVLFSSLAPAITMSILGFFLWKNIRILRHRITPITDLPPPTTHRTYSRISKIDKQLTTMLATESLIAIVTYVPYAIELTYSNISEQWNKTALQKAWEKVFIELIHLFSYIFFATSFYVSFMTNNGFRRKVQGFFRKQRRIQHHHHHQSISVLRIQTFFPTN